jgi:hypothetical protein
MKKIAIASASVLCLVLAHPVFAQDTTGATGTQSSEAQAANTVNVTAVAQGPTGPQRNDVDYSGHTWTTPSVGGSYFGGTNPCLVGTGGGAAGGPIGFSLNLGRSDEACTRRSDAAAWHALGFSNIAVARMCQDQKNADAFFSSTGFACPGTRGTGRYKLASGELAPEAVLYNSGPAGASLPQYRPQQPPQPPQRPTAMAPAQQSQTLAAAQPKPTIQQTHNGQPVAEGSANN